MAQEATNPFASSWAMQLQQNNNWTEMPRGEDRTRVQSNLVFQPLIECEADREAGADYPPRCDNRQFRPPFRSERTE